MATASTVTIDRGAYIDTPIGRLGGDVESVTENLFKGIKLDIAGTATNQQINLDWVRSKAKVIGLYCKKNDDASGTAQGLTIKSNSTSSPGDTLTLIPGTPVIWLAANDPAENMPFPSADVTKLYVTSPGGVTQELMVVVLMDEGA